MARGARPRGQRNAAERLMPRAEYEALEARRQARRDRGDDSDDSTVTNDDDDDDDDGGLAAQVDQGDLADLDLDEEIDAGAIEDTIDAAIRHSTTSMFQRVLMFNQGAAESLYDDQMITTIEILRELDDATIKDTCRAIKKPGGAAMGYQISKLSVTRFKLFAFLGEAHVADLSNN